MTGQLAQMISLITFYNSKQKPTPNFSEFESFKSSKFVNFIQIKPKLFFFYREVELADSPEKWFDYLKSSGCIELKLYKNFMAESADHRTASFVDGGQSFFIEAIYEKHSDIWVSRWNTNDNESDRIWEVTYGLVVKKSVRLKHEDKLNEYRDKLRNKLIEISQFASNVKNLDDWCATFDTAAQLLDEPNPADVYALKIIAPNSVPLEALQLLAAASKSNVFGGMGSWNDIGYFDSDDIQSQYNLLSAELFDLINESIITAINYKK